MQKTLMVLCAAALTACGSAKHESTAVSAVESVAQHRNSDIVGTDTIVPRLISVETMTGPVRPGGPIPQPASKLRFLFAMNGCLDQLGAVTYTTEYDRERNKLIYLISGTNMAVRGSQVTRCAVMPTKIVEVYNRPFLNMNDIEVRGLTEKIVTKKAPKDTVAVTAIEGELVSVVNQAPNCPPNAMCEPVAKLRIKFVMPGCLDKLLSVRSYASLDSATGKWNYRVSGIAAQTRGSMAALCAVMPAKTVEIVHGMGLLSKEQVVMSPLTNATIR